MSVAADLVMGGMKLGDSMAVNGACLTVVEMGAKEFSVDLSPETLRRTSLGDLAPGKVVNLERPLAVSDRPPAEICTGSRIHVVSSR